MDNPGKNVGKEELGNFCCQNRPFYYKAVGQKVFVCLFVCLFDKYITCHYLKRLNSLPNIFIFIRVLTSQTLNVSLII